MPTSEVLLKELEQHERLLELCADCHYSAYSSSRFRGIDDGIAGLN